MFLLRGSYYSYSCALVSLVIWLGTGASEGLTFSASSCVENVTTGGDVTRTWRLPADRPDDDVTAYFSSCNLGKRSVALNLKDTRGLAAVHR